MKLNIQLFAITKTTTFTESALTEQNIIDNNSSVSITIYFNPNNTSTWFSSKTLYCTCNGVQQSANVSLSKGGSVSKTFTFNNIAHNDDGTKSVSWSWNCNTGTSALGNISASGTKQLQTIPRASQPSLVTWPDTTYDITMGEQIYIHTNKRSQSFTHNVYYNFGSLTDQLIASNVTDNCLWTPPLTMADQIPNSTNGIGNVLMKTYDGTTFVGEKSVTFRANIPSSIGPSVSIGTLTEANQQMIDLNWGVFVQNKSQLNIPITASGIYNSTISSVVTTINNLSFIGTNITTSTLITAGNNTISTKTTDSRGRQATATKTYNVVAYSNPAITKATAVRCLQDGTESDEGTYLKYSFDANISPVNNKNAKTFRIGYKPKSSEIYTYVTIDNSNYSINKTNQILGGVTLDTSLSYDIVFEAIDTFTTTKIDRQLDSGFDLMNFNASGKAMAIGKVSEAESNEELLEVGLDTKFYKDVSIDGGITKADFVELYFSTPYIDFHFDEASQDYTTRLIEASAGIMHLLEHGGRRALLKANIDGNSDLQEIHIADSTGDNTGTYVKLCNIEYRYHIQGLFTSMRIFIGEGNNSRNDQNAFIDLTMQLGWAGQNDGRLGCTWELHKMKTGFDLSNVRIIVIANSNINYDVYLWTNKTYCRTCYTLEVDRNTTTTHIGTISTTMPTGVQCEIDGLMIAYQ